MQIEFLEDLSELTKLKNIPNLKKLIFELYSEKFDISQLPTQIEELSVQAYHLNLTPLTNFKNLKKLRRRNKRTRCDKSNINIKGIRNNK